MSDLMLECRCGCPYAIHVHLRDSEDCGRCGREACPSFRRRPVVRLAVASALDRLGFLLGRWNDAARERWPHRWTFLRWRAVERIIAPLTYDRRRPR